MKPPVILLQEPEACFDEWEQRLVVDRLARDHAATA